MAATLDPLGILAGAAVVVCVGATLYWMLHPPQNRTVLIAKSAAEHASEIAGNVLVVFSPDIHSEVLMALAMRMAKGRDVQVVAIYVIEVPYTLPMDAALPAQERQALEVLTAAEEIGHKVGIEIQTRTVRQRQAGPGIIETAREENASLIVMGTYREQRYAGAPLGQTIDYVTTHTHTDVLIGVSGMETESVLNIAPAVTAAVKRAGKA